MREYDGAMCERCTQEGDFTGDTYLHGTFCEGCKSSFTRWMLGADTDGTAVRSFAEAIMHGDAHHRSWLSEAAESFLANGTVPGPPEPLN